MAQTRQGTRGGGKGGAGVAEVKAGGGLWDLHICIGILYIHVYVCVHTCVIMDTYPYRVCIVQVQ